nr:MAG TPA: hypothetical protein [Caudoviricetes sp.]
MIKGRYVAMVTIDFHFPDELASAPLDELKKRLIINADSTLRRVIEDECSLDYDIVDVQQQYADLYRVPDDDTEDDGKEKL